VGNYVSSGGHAQTLTEAWNGSTWSLVNSPNSSSTQANLLSGVSCTSSSFCFAVGNYVNSGGRHECVGVLWSSHCPKNTRGDGMTQILSS
jgi:hypothetical protein